MQANEAKNKATTSTTTKTAINVCVREQTMNLFFRFGNE